MFSIFSMGKIYSMKGSPYLYNNLYGNYNKVKHQDATYLTDNDGVFLTDNDGAYLLDNE